MNAVDPRAIVTPSGRSGAARRPALRIASAELRLMLREPMVAVGLVGFPLVTVLILAGVFGQSPDPEFGGVAPDSHYVVGYLAVVLAQLGLVTVPVHLATHRELGVLRRYRASGIGSRTLVGSELAIGAVLGTVAAVVVAAGGGALYGLPAPDEPLGVAVWFALGLACFMAIGCAIGATVGSGRAANALGNLLFVPMFLLGGGGPPREVMTGPMQRLSDALPLSHIAGGLRRSWLGQTNDPHAMWWPMLVTVIATAIAVRAVRRQSL
jgi:ABC-2 type transport system permease protein